MEQAPFPFQLQSQEHLCALSNRNIMDLFDFVTSDMEDDSEFIEATMDLQQSMLLLDVLKIMQARRR